MVKPLSTDTGLTTLIPPKTNVDIPLTVEINKATSFVKSSLPSDESKQFQTTIPETHQEGNYNQSQIKAKRGLAEAKENTLRRRRR
ncbi:unnamed protein product, partial [Didymodactylos carnosus]